MPSPEPAVATPGARAAPDSCRALFAAFTRLALQGFGGVLPVAQRELVERLGWLTRSQFLELLALSQVLPGPNVVNLALIYGDRCFGWRGALAACTGMLLLPLVVVLALTMAALRFGEVPAVAGALRGMGVVAAGMVLATAIRLAPGLRGNPLGRGAAIGLVAATVVAVAVLRWPLPLVVPCLGLPGIALAAWRLREASA